MKQSVSVSCLSSLHYAFGFRYGMGKVNAVSLDQTMPRKKEETVKK